MINHLFYSRLEALISKRLDEIAESTDLRYISMIGDVYSKVKESMREGIYEDFISCIVDSINEAKLRVSK